MGACRRAAPRRAERAARCARARSAPRATGPRSRCRYRSTGPHSPPARSSVRPRSPASRSPASLQYRTGDKSRRVAGRPRPACHSLAPPGRVSRCKKRALLVRTAPMPGCGARATAPRCTYGSCASPRRTSGRRALNILGISGFERAIPFKRAHWPGLDEREYRLSQGHDSAAVLVADGSVVAAVAEERMDRRKHSGDFPRGAIAYCLAEAGLSLDDVDEIVHGFDYGPERDFYGLDPLSEALYREVYSRDALLALVRRDLPGFPETRVRAVRHHLAHAASAFYTSGWDECVVLVADGMGEAHGVTAYRAHDGRLDPVLEIGAHDSIGVLYSLVTLHLGFDFNADEYKIMGLAPYGDPERFRPFFEEAVELVPGGGVRIPLVRANRTREEREHYSASRRLLSERLVRPRAPDEEIGDVHRDVDAALAAFADRVDVVRFPTLAETCGRAARLIADGRVVAWYRGRLEFGPRALGHRSILADPGHPGMRDRINAMVKMREAFRPFAPAVSVEEAPRWFEVAPGTELPFMIMTVDVRPEHRAALPAITHVNGSARLQTVSARDNGEFHALLQAVGRTTGREMVLNTSFNVKGQPIVNTPREALETVLGNRIEYLFLENVLVSRRVG